MSPKTLKTHDITLQGQGIILRPMSEEDWEVLAHWNSDPEILWFTEGDDIQSYSLDEVKGIYRSVSQTAFCFIIELNGKPIGECWLQEMNLGRILALHPGKDCRRIDLLIGEKSLWGGGYGSEAIRMLTAFSFEKQKADLIYGPGIADYNPRSLGGFLKNGYHIVRKITLPPGMKARFEQDVVLSKQAYFGNQAKASEGGQHQL